jgi:hypothetical protein
MRMPKKTLLTAALAASAVWLSGCFLGADESGPSAAQKKRSETTVTEANGNLQTAVSGMQDSQYKYGKEDLTELKAAQANYAEAARLNPGNSRAQLGLALANILVAAQDPRLADILNRTVEGKSPFDSKLAGDAPMLRSLVLAKVADASAWPEFHAIQDSIATVLLPALEDAIARIDIAYRDPAFSMTLTLGGKARELDHVEAGILLAGVRALHGLVTLWLSYDVDIDYQGSYDWITALQDLGDVKKFSDLTDAQRDALKKGTELFGPDAPFMAVRPAWKERLSKVDDEIQAALDILRESLASLSHETDAQDDDLIHICAPFEAGSCLAVSAYQKGLDGLDTASKYMKQPYLVRLDDIDTTIRVDFSAYFRVQDYKKMLPYYGFYDPKDWSDEKPALYFTDKAGHITGNIMTVKQISDEADSLGTPAVQVVAQLRAVIHLQDPTYQGYLPGATEDALWNILLKKAKLQDSRAPVVALRKGAVSTLRPDFALGLIRN